MAVKYFFEHRDELGTLWRYELDRAGFAGSPTELLATEDIFVLEYLSREDELAQIQKGARLDAFLLIRNSTEEDIVEEIFNAPLGEFSAILKKNAVEVWRGMVLNEFGETSDGPYPHTAIISAMDMDDWATEPFSNNGNPVSGQVPIIELLVQILNNKGYNKPIYSTTFYKESGVDDEKDILKTIYVDQRQFWEEERNRPYSLQYVINQLCARFWTIPVQWKGWNLLQIPALLQNTIETFEYDEAGQIEDTLTDHIPQLDYTDADVFVLPPARRRLTKPYRVAQLNFDHRSEFSVIQFENRIFMQTSADDVTESMFFIPTGAQEISLEGRVFVNVTNEDADEGIVPITIRAGQYWWDAFNQEWSLTLKTINLALFNNKSQNDLELEGGGGQVEKILTLEYNINTTPIPSDTDGPIFVTLAVAEIDGHISTTYFNTRFSIFNGGLAEGDSRAVIFQAISQGTGANILNYGTVIIGDGPATYSRSALRRAENGGLTQSWFRKGEVTTVPLDRLVVDDLLLFQRSNREDLTAEIRAASFTPITIFNYRGGKFLFVGGKLKGRTGYWYGVFKELKRDDESTNFIITYEPIEDQPAAVNPGGGGTSVVGGQTGALSWGSITGKPNGQDAWAAETGFDERYTKIEETLNLDLAVKRIEDAEPLSKVFDQGWLNERYGSLAQSDNLDMLMALNEEVARNASYITKGIIADDHLPFKQTEKNFEAIIVDNDAEVFGDAIIEGAVFAERASVADLTETGKLAVDEDRFTVDGEQFIFDASNGRLKVGTDDDVLPVLRSSGDEEGNKLLFLNISEDKIEEAPIEWNGSEFVTDEGFFSDDYVSQLIGMKVDFSDGSIDTRYIYTDELRAKAFIADVTQALAGSDFLTKSVALLSRNFTVPTATNSSRLFVEDLPGLIGFAAFQANDWIRLRVVDRSNGLLIADAWGTVTDYEDEGDGEQSWLFTAVHVTNSAGQVVNAGAVALDYGQGGDGFIERTVLDTAGSPYDRIVTWVTDPSNPANYTVQTQLGALDGILWKDNPLGAGFGLFARDRIFLQLGGSNPMLIGRDAGGAGLHGIFQNSENYWYGDGQFRIGDEDTYINLDPTAEGKKLSIFVESGSSSIDITENGATRTRMTADLTGFSFLADLMKYEDWNGTVNEDGNITARGTTGWAITKLGEASFQKGFIGSWVLDQDKLASGDVEINATTKEIMVKQGTNKVVNINDKSTFAGALFRGDVPIYDTSSSPISDSLNTVTINNFSSGGPIGVGFSKGQYIKINSIDVILDYSGQKDIGVVFQLYEGTKLLAQDVATFLDQEGNPSELTTLTFPNSIMGFFYLEALGTLTLEITINEFNNPGAFSWEFYSMIGAIQVEQSELNKRGASLANLDAYNKILLKSAIDESSFGYFRLESTALDIDPVTGEPIVTTALYLDIFVKGERKKSVLLASATEEDPEE